MHFECKAKARAHPQEPVLNRFRRERIDSLLRHIRRLQSLATEPLAGLTASVRLATCAAVVLGLWLAPWARAGATPAPGPSQTPPPGVGLPDDAARGTDGGNHSLFLDGRSTYVRVPNSQSLNLTGPLTVEAWIRTNATSPQGIVERYNWLSTPDGGFALRLNDEGKLQFHTIRSSGENDQVTGNTTVGVGDWHHVAGVFDGDELRVYLDGKVDGVKASTMSPASGTADLTIGAGGEPEGHLFDGLIDSARVSAGTRYFDDFIPARRPSDCQSHLQPETGCRGVWTFDTEDGEDSSGFANHGVLMEKASFSTETYEEAAGGALPAERPTAAPFAEQHIHFDELLPAATVNAVYPDIRFQAQTFSTVWTANGVEIGGAGSSPPHVILPASNKFLPIQISFPRPVDNLRFSVVGQDDEGRIAIMDIFRDSTFAASRDIVAHRRTNQALIQDIGAEFNHVTAVVVRSITDGASIAYDDFKFNVSPPLPLAPTNLRSSASSNQVSLAWNGSEHATSYKVKRATSSGGPYQTIGTTATTGFSDFNATQGLTYFYVVSAVNSAGESPNSNQTSARIPKPPLPPTNLTSRGGSERVFLNWVGSAGATSYNVKRLAQRVDADFIQIAAGIATTSFVDTRLPNRVYQYVVTAVNNDGESGPSNVVEESLFSCSDREPARPAPRQIQSAGWSLTVEASPDDGIVLHDVSLDGRFMAKTMSVPYFVVKTNKMTEPRRGEMAVSNEDAPFMRSRLVSFEVNRLTTTSGASEVGVIIKGKYKIDRLSEESQSCLFIEQTYTFRSAGTGCEFSSSLECARFYPKVSYHPELRGGEVLESITIPQRFHYNVSNTAGNAVGLFLDCNRVVACIRVDELGLPRASIFSLAANPLLAEYGVRVIEAGQDQKKWDNIHQTWRARVSEPVPEDLPAALTVPAGCPECVHTHWRWGTFTSKFIEFLDRGSFGGGRLLIKNTSQRDVDIAFVRASSAPEEVDPFDYRFLLNGQPLLGPGGQPEDVVTWYVSTGHQFSDEFFEHGSFFGTSRSNVQRALVAGPPGSGPDTLLVANEADGPKNVRFGHLYLDGESSFRPGDPNAVGPLPSIYSPFNNVSYDIRTAAIASGPHVVTFTVPSVTDPALFNNLRILKAEPDEFDPDELVWVDRTILSPDPEGPNFGERSIKARVEELGVFTIVRLNGTLPPARGRADLAVTVVDSPDPALAGDNLTYSINVFNRGPQAATGVGLMDGLPPETAFVSVSPASSCDYDEGTVVCHLGALDVGASTTVTLVVKPSDRGTIPSGGKTISTSAFVRSAEEDPNTGDNRATQSTTVLPAANAAPTISTLSPAALSAIPGPANIAIIAAAADRDGSISRVEFFDGTTLIGAGEAIGGGQYRLFWNNVGFGEHTIGALATDNLGKVAAADPVGIFVNGTAVIRITNPLPDSLVPPSTSVSLTASVSLPPGTISRVEFYADDRLLGPGTPAGGDQYRFTWVDPANGSYLLVAIVTDNSNVATVSKGVPVTVTSPPSVSMTSPADGASFPPAVSIDLRASATDADGSVDHVDFFANGVLLGSGIQAGNAFTYTWNSPADGIYSVAAEAVDDLGVKTRSTFINVAVNTPGLSPGELIWFDDAIPQGATEIGLNDGWFWVDANPAPFLGAKAHQSRIANGVHQHGFQGASFQLPLNPDDKLYTYVFLSPGFKPQEIMLEWKDENSWEHRAYWTDKAVGNWINFGVDGTASRLRMGPLPPEGRWVRLEVSAAALGLSGKLVNGMSFMLHGGRATFDRTGKTNRPLPPPPSPGDTIWFDDALPAGSVAGTRHDHWSWTASNPAPFSGSNAHQTFQGDSGDPNEYRAHFFTGATQGLPIDPGDVLFTHVFLDPIFTPDEIILEWHDGTSWNHRAYWGSSFVFNGRLGTEGMRFMGELPPAGSWARLEVPASYVGLEGKTVRGMSFGMNREGRRGLATWDLSGKSTLPPTTMIEPLFATTPIHQYFHPSEGFYYFLSDRHGAGLQARNRWFVHSNQAGGTVPLFRMRNTTSRRYLFTTNPGNPGSGWVVDRDPALADDGIPFYLYTHPGTPETVALHVFRGPLDYYFTIDPQDSTARTMTHEGSVGWVHPTRSIMSPMPNSIDDPVVFVKQHYRDFLGREADADGLAFWLGDYNRCLITDLPCVDNKRSNISGAFFLSIEFQQTGYFVYRFHKASYNVQPRRQQLFADKAIVSAGVIVGSGGWEEQLENNKTAFAAGWVDRPEFRARFDGLSNGLYVDTLYANAGIVPAPDARIALVNGLNAGTETRATALRKIVETPAFHAKEFNPAFVLMQYFGYLQRNPDDPPDNDFSGYQFWLNKLNAHGGNFVTAEMVKSFLVSGEYRARFGQPNGPNSAANLTVGVNVSAKVGNMTGQFSQVASAGLMKVNGVYPWTVDQPPAGYTFFKNLAWKVTTTSSTSPPYTLTASIPWEVADPAQFANLRIFNREGGAWVDRTILAPDAPAPDFNARTISARVHSLTTVIVAHQGNAGTSLAFTSPSNGSAFSAPAIIGLDTSSHDPDGIIAKVEFYDGDALIGEDATAPYGMSWSNVGSGTHTITAKASDNMGIAIASASVSVVVNGAPAVIIASPAGGAVFETPANIPLTVYASGSGGIAKVEFFQGSTRLGEDTTAPYSFNWNGVGVGGYTLTARATSSLNTMTTSPSVSVTVVNTPPTVAITSPVNGGVLGAAPASVVINASATDGQGIRNVEFFQNGVSLGVDGSAPYTFTWSNVAPGSFSLTARATDNLGTVTTSTPVTVTVTNAPPSVSITSPSGGANYSAPATITINATATDNEGIRKVEFFQNTTKLGEDTTAPYSFTWTNVGSGSYGLTARATDNLDATTPSVSVLITVGDPLFTLFADDFNDNTLDTGKWLVLAPGAATTVIERNQRLEITPPTAGPVTDYNGIASVATLDMTNAQVTVEVPQYALGYGHESFLRLRDDSTSHYLLVDAGGGGLVLQDSVTGSAGRTVITSYNTSTHRFWRVRHVPATDAIVWETSPDGSAWNVLRTIARTFAITAMQVQLVAGKYAGPEPPLSTTVFDNLRVASPVANTGPTVSLTSPANGASYAAPANIAIQAAATDSDGAVTRVEFFQNGASLGVDTVAPFSYTWNGAPAGTYVLTAKATDNRGATTTSGTINVIVNAPPSVTWTIPANGTTYTAPAFLTLGASATDSDGTVSLVEFFQNGVSLGVDTNAPYAVSWNNVAAGAYTLAAKATDNRGATAMAAPLSIAVNDPANAPPSVSLTAPAGGAVFTEPAAITLAATASDADGTTTGVEFFQNGISLALDTTSPYSFSWLSVAAGSYSLTARATDNRGASTTSAAVQINVMSQADPRRADTIGVHADATFYLRNRNTPGPADIVVTYGSPDEHPVVGDWDGNGTTTVGVFVPDAGDYGAPGRPCFLLNNGLSVRDADTVVCFGDTGDLPLAGDWDGDGIATVGVYRPSEHTFYLRNTNSDGPADLVIPFLVHGDTPLSGDWDGDGLDTIGIHNSGSAAFYLRNSNSPGPPDLTVSFGDVGAKPIVGDWDGDGKTTVGAYTVQGSTFRLRNTNTNGVADLVVPFGGANAIPVAGNWDGTRPVCCGDVVWFDEDLPAGAITFLDEKSWGWIGAAPIPASGTWALQSIIGASEHSYVFAGATERLAVAAGDKLLAYVYLDPANRPREILLQWHDGNWEHRAYWGANIIDLGVDGTSSRRYMGPLPPAGQWVRLEVPASQVGLEGRTLDGMSFVLSDGRATWDRVGKNP